MSIRLCATGGVRMAVFVPALASQGHIIGDADGSNPGGCQILALAQNPTSWAT